MVDFRHCEALCEFGENAYGTVGTVSSMHDKEVLSPFVRITFSSDKEEITVGNESYPSGQPQHTAVITSFEHGASGSQKCYVTIHDIEGGAFHLFLKKLIKEPEDLQKATGLFMKVKYGWVYSKCNSHVGGIHRSSENIYFLPDNIQTIYSNGKITFNIEGGEMLIPGEEFRCNTTFGQEGQEMHLEDAITQLLATLPAPVVNKVEFLMSDRQTKLKWKGSGDVKEKGPKEIWLTNNLTKKAAIEKWLSTAGCLSENDKGFMLQWDGGVSVPTLLIIEDPKPKKGEPDIFGKRVETYVINAGNCSPVLEFNPKFNWKWQYRGASGGYQNATDVGTKTSVGEPRAIEPEGTGAETKNAVGNRDISIEGKNASEESRKAKNAQEYANIIYGEEIEANLVIQGDPRKEYTSTITRDLYKIAIVAINPFYLQSQKTGCPDFLVKSEHKCNAALTSPNWRIRGVNHYIKEGSYITTLNVWLVVGTVKESLAKR